MKKGIAVGISAVLVAICALFIQGYLSVPKISDIHHAVSVSDDGLIYLVQEDGYSWNLYGINSHGVMKEYYPQTISDATKKGSILNIHSDGDTIYEVIEIRNRISGNAVEWNLVAVDRHGGMVTTVAKADTVMFSAVLDLTVEDELLILSGISGDGHYLSGYEIKAGAEPELIYMQPIPGGEQVRDAVYACGTVFMMTQHGRVGKYTVTGFSDIKKEQKPDQIGILVKGENQVWYYDKGYGRISPISQGAGDGLSLPPHITASAVSMKSLSSCVMLGVYDGEKSVIVRQESGNYWLIDSLTASIKISFRLSKPYIPGTVGIVLLGTGFFVLVWWVYGRNGRISLKLSFLCLITSLVLGILWLLFLKMDGIAMAEQKTLMTAGMMVVFVMFLACSVTVEYITRPLRSLKRFMDKIADGNYHISKSTRSNDEVAAVWSSLNHMCGELESRRYRDRNLIRSYYRFVPREIHRIFEKENITDLRSGEVKSVNGTVGIISVQNREYIRKKSTDGVYMELVNYCFFMLLDTCARHDGILASNEFDLSGIKVLFPSDGHNAIPFGIELLSGNRDKQKEAQYEMGLFMIVHKTNYLYGLAGTGDQSFPFFVSGEMEFLASYTDHFCDLGVGMVMTEQALKSSDQNHTARYIGFLSMEDDGYCYKLYEILDACPEGERVQKKKLEAKFQEALQLYYKNDFYLARNHFSAIIKECPGDGIARWYLFASEYYFNLGEVDGTDYSLFHSAVKVEASPGR